MAARYAAAHARRDQRRAGASGRQYLPLAEETARPEIGTEDGRSGLHLGRGTAPALTSRLPAIDYSYLRADLRRIAVLAACLFATLIILSFIVHV